MGRSPVKASSEARRCAIGRWRRFRESTVLGGLDRLEQQGIFVPSDRLGFRPCESEGHRARATSSPSFRTQQELQGAFRVGTLHIEVRVRLHAREGSREAGALGLEAREAVPERVLDAAQRLLWEACDADRAQGAVQAIGPAPVAVPPAAPQPEQHSRGVEPLEQVDLVSDEDSDSDTTTELVEPSDATEATEVLTPACPDLADDASSVQPSGCYNTTLDPIV